MEKLGEALGGLIIIGGAIAIVYIIARYNYLLKRAMIHKGMTPPLLSQKIKFLDIGCIIIGLGLGLLISTIFTEMDISEDTMDLLVWGTISLFGGISLLVVNWLRSKVEK